MKDLHVFYSLISRINDHSLIVIAGCWYFRVTASLKIKVQFESIGLHWIPVVMDYNWATSTPEGFFLWNNFPKDLFGFYSNTSLIDIPKLPALKI